LPSNSPKTQNKKGIQESSSTSTRYRLHQADILLNITKTIAAFETLDEVLVALVEITTKELDADRGTIFLNDPETSELYSRTAIGIITREIRILNTSGIAGHVFTSGEGLIINDAYNDSRFNRDVDGQTGYVTKSILCTPIITVRGEMIGVAQILNKHTGEFNDEDMDLLNAMTAQAAVILQSTQFVERMKKSHSQEMKFVDVVSDMISEIDLGALLQKVIGEVTQMLNCERSTLFLNDEKTNELYSQVGEGLGVFVIRIPNHKGIAGAVFASGETMNIPHAYADLRFDPATDRQSGYFTRSILCVPVVNKAGKTIGVTQALNKRGESFTAEDESRLKAFTTQVSIALENAKLFDDIRNMKKYNEGMLESMSNGVITLDEEGKIITCNSAGLNLMQLEPEAIINQPAEDFFSGSNAWVLEKINKIEETQKSEIVVDANLEFAGEALSVNLTVLPLISMERKKIGSMIIFEDITSEKRMKSTMSRYMDPEIADRLLENGEDILGGKSAVVTVLFSDIRGFTPLTEELGAQGTVTLLNEYFTQMVECIQKEGGMLDKFIGDAIMAAFGIPLVHDDDEDRAVRAAIAMMVKLTEWNTRRMDEGKKLVNIGIGINTDQVVTGNIGSPKRMDYTLIGDGVNLAARLESGSKQYSANILISDYTFKKLKGTYRSREIDRVVVKGKTEPVCIHEILDYHNDETFPNMMEVLNSFKYGVEHYRKKNWEVAKEAFNSSLDLNPNDALSKIYIERCNYLNNNPPKDGWDGVWVMTEK
jgi:adenylate cyclase